MWQWQGTWKNSILLHKAPLSGALIVGRVLQQAQPSDTLISNPNCKKKNIQIVQAFLRLPSIFSGLKDTHQSPRVSLRTHQKWDYVQIAEHSKEAPSLRPDQRVASFAPVQSGGTRFMIFSTKTSSEVGGGHVNPHVYIYIYTYS